MSACCKPEVASELPAALIRLLLINLIACASAHAATTDHDLSRYREIDATGRPVAVLGDIRVYLDDHGRPLKSSKLLGVGNGWSGGVLYYQFSDQITEFRRAQFRQAFASWGIGTAIQFIESPVAFDRVLVTTGSGSGCGSSAVGMIGGVQILNIVDQPGCWSQTVLQHEVGHALGFKHEHQRDDRDSYLNVSDFDSLEVAHPEFFDANYGRSEGSHYTSYDYASVMHYGPVQGWDIDGQHFDIDLDPNQSQPAGLPSGSESVCTTAQSCRALMGFQQVSPRDLLGGALRYGRRLDQNPATRPVVGTVSVVGGFDTCGPTPGCWRANVDATVTIELTAAPGHVAVLSTDGCERRGATATCNVTMDRNRQFTAFTFPIAAALVVLDDQPLPERVFGDGFE